jgi:hypothetical protein
VKEVGTAVLSKKGVYHVMPVTIEPVISTVRKDLKYYFTFKPAWLSPEFNPKTDFAGRGDRFLYRMNIGNADKRRTAVLPQLLILAGGEDGRDEFYANAGAQGGFDSPEEFSTALSDAIQGAIVGFTLSQDTEKDDEGDTVLLDRRSISDFFTSDSVERLNEIVLKEMEEAETAEESGEEYRRRNETAWEVDDESPFETARDHVSE